MRVKGEFSYLNSSMMRAVSPTLCHSSSRICDTSSSDSSSMNTSLAALYSDDTMLYLTRRRPWQRYAACLLSLPPLPPRPTLLSRHRPSSSTIAVL